MITGTLSVPPGVFPEQWHLQQRKALAFISSSVMNDEPGNFIVLPRLFLNSSSFSFVSFNALNNDTLKCEYQVSDKILAMGPSVLTF